VYHEYLKECKEYFEDRVEPIPTPFGLLSPDFYAFDGYIFLGDRKNTDEHKIRWLFANPHRLDKSLAFLFVPYTFIDEIAAQQLTTFLKEKHESQDVMKLLQNVV
jgi:hypothetical protein